MGRCFWPALYLSLAVAAYEPIRSGQWHALAAGSVHAGVVSLFNLWTIWWNADRLGRGLHQYWDAPIFWPEKLTFALSEPQPLTLFVAPLVWAFGPTLALHVYFVVNSALNGWFGYRLARAIGGAEWAAGLAGALVTWLPLVFQQPELVQYVPLWPALWTWLIIVRRNSQPFFAAGLTLGGAIALSFAACLHLGLINLLVVVPAVVVVAVWRGTRTELLPLTLGVLVATVLLCPIIVPVAHSLSVHGSLRPLELVRHLSASSSDWLSVPRQALVPPWPLGGSQRPLHPGWFRLMFSLGTLLVLLGPAQSPNLSRRGIALLWMIAVFGFLGSFGARMHIGGVSPWQIVSKVFPPLGWIRSPYRFAYLFQPAVLILAAIGFQVLMARFYGLLKPNRPMKKCLALAFAGAMGVYLVAEVPPARCVLVPAPRFWAPPEWVEYLSQRPVESAGVLLLDFPPHEKLLLQERTVRTMLWQAKFHLPLVNGYSGFVPQSWERRRQMWINFPYSPECLRDLETIGVHLLIRPPEFPPPPSQAVNGFQLKRLFQSGDGVEIWQLVRLPK